MAKQHDELVKLNDEAKALGKSQVIKTEEGRAIVNLLQRMIEVDLFGRTLTDPIKRNHE